MKIQLAIQGGGARIVSLLGAMNALQNLSKTKNPAEHIEITRIIGTSAGAIAGTLLVAGVDIAAFRDKIKNTVRKELLKELPAIGIKHYASAIAGKPLWKSTALRRLLTQAFDEVGMKTLQDIQKKRHVDVNIVATDLQSEAPVIYRSRDKEEINIVKALMDSCAIPFYFRTWKETLLHQDKLVPNTIVDGGIVQNFPCEELLEYEATDGEVFGISFGPYAVSAPSSLMEYNSALLNTAMESATERARRALGSSRVLRIVHRFGTFDFQEALQDIGLVDHFDGTRDFVESWFSERVANPRNFIAEDAWQLQDPTTMKSLVKMYDSQHAPSLLLYEKIVYEVTAHGLRDSRQPDDTITTLEFRTLNDPIYCHRVGLTETKALTDLKSSTFLLSGPGDVDIPTGVIPLVDAGTIETKEVLIFFDRVLPPNSGPYTLRMIESVQSLSAVLASEQQDHIATAGARTDQPIGQYDVVVRLPKRFKDKTLLTPYKSNPLPGKEMSKAKLAPFNNVPDFFPVGWTGKTVPPTEAFGFLLKLAP